MKPIFDLTLHNILNERLAKLEAHFNADVIFYYGPIADALEKPFRDFIEDLKNDTVQHDTLCIILNTPGGSAETVEKTCEDNKTSLSGGLLYSPRCCVFRRNYILHVRRQNFHGLFIRSRPY